MTVETYIERLNSALRDFETDAFANLVKELEGENAALVKKVGAKWSGWGSKITSKKKAILAINDRREALRIGRAKSFATGNRVAA